MKSLLYTLAALLCLFPARAFAQCPNNNTLYETKAAPVSSATDVTTELYGGEYTRLTGLVAGYTYQIGNCGDNAFDSQITIYRAGSTLPVAFNDDYEVCTPQSRIYFTPQVSGDYDILVDEYDCLNNFSAFTTVTISLFDGPQPTVVIPTVVHVVYNNAAENISVAQIQSQIDVLNADFRRMNADLAFAPSRFSGFSKDLHVEFCLASTDPFGNPTTGITRTQTIRTSFDPADNFMKSTADGGRDPWPRDLYMNIWVCNLTGQTLGYAAFPGGPAAEDGIVIGYQYFGTMGTAAPPFNLGRTGTHEVGHWLNLRHIWGDDGSACTGSDDVNDTPNQAGSNSGCPMDPVSCSNGGLGGDMYVNYMDYSDDACLHMFSYWQWRRVQATLDGPRSSLGTSGGCNIVGTEEAIKGDNYSVTASPNPTAGDLRILVDLPPGQLKETEFRLLNLLGKEIIYQKGLASKILDLSLGHLPQGIYLYQITNPAGRTVSGKVVLDKL